LKFVCILWNYFDLTPISIINEIGVHASFLNISILHLESHFDNFVKEVYSIDGIFPEYIIYKIEHMKKKPYRKVFIVELDIIDPRLTFDKVKQKNISNSIITLKQSIRSKFDNNFDNDINNSIIHCTDNSDETNHLVSLVNIYSNICFVERFDLT